MVQSRKALEDAKKSDSTQQVDNLTELKRKGGRKSKQPGKAHLSNFNIEEIRIFITFTKKKLGQS